MLLSKELEPLFGPEDRRRGNSYYRRGEVHDLRVICGVIHSDVYGSFGKYEVIINLKDLENEDALTCSCLRFADGYLCKHLWAVVLQFDEMCRSHGFDSTTQKRTDSLGIFILNPVPRWHTVLNQVRAESLDPSLDSSSPNGLATLETRESEVLYLIDIGSMSRYNSRLELSVMQRVRRNDGKWGQLKPLQLSHNSIHRIGQETDRRIAGQLLGAKRHYARVYSYHATPHGNSSFMLDPYWPPELCQHLIDSQRFFWALDKSLPTDEFHPITLVDLKTPASVALNVSERKGSRKSDLLKVELTRDGQLIDDDSVVHIADNGVILLTDRIYCLSILDTLELWKQTKDEPPVEIRQTERTPFLVELARQNLMSQVSIPEYWKVTKTEGLLPKPVLKLSPNPERQTELCGSITFFYGEMEVPFASKQMSSYDENSNSWFERNQEAESKRLEELSEFPVAHTVQAPWADSDFTIRKRNLLDLVDKLSEKDWVINLYGKQVRQSGVFDISVESGQDWFDLSVNVDFNGDTIALPQLLQAISRKESFIVLADGSRGRIAEDLIRKYARLAEFGQVKGDNIRFRPTQALLLDAMLDAKGIKTDRGFHKFREKLKSFDGIQPKDPPRGFHGKLREYQTEGLGWLHFLNQFEMGGCLADDMGLGKTIQVLSLLEHRRTRRIVKTETDSNTTVSNEESGDPPKGMEKKKRSSLAAIISGLKRKPSIVVVPKSLIFNWIEEAAKFTPHLRILNYTGTMRQNAVERAVSSGGFDVLLTTYGTVRRDIDLLSQIEFDYAILDESQAIKNSKAQCSKACRLLNTDHRLAMTGTPIENHLGELWSLFEFLNPGLLGNASGFARLTNLKKNNEAEREETLTAISRALRPYLLRRTKEQVLTELPPKTEQTLYCDMLPAQKNAYNELKNYYRVKLAKKVETDGMGKSKIQVLEALLRLRQVACDPRLIDESAKAGAKLQLLQQQLSDIISEGHKVLIFSQFTSLLKLVQQQFDQHAISYEYLDGKSRKRADSVKRFQEDPSVQAFLISIKAGGHGLNLTAADYVFLLDPWWNPAVEAQAIDRAHRIGQNNPVIAYRFVCRDTVEEKILELQKSKKALAEEVIRSDESLIKTLTASDLQLILS